MPDLEPCKLRELNIQKDVRFGSASVVILNNYSYDFKLRFCYNTKKQKLLKARVEGIKTVVIFHFID